jgi:GNAT superfamily N-acetyltransferase
VTTKWTVTPEGVDAADAVALLRAYLLEIIGRYWGRVATEQEVDRELATGEDYRLDLLLIARHDGVPAGCAGLRRVGAETIELKRVFVRPEFRGQGCAAVLLAAFEDHAVRLGAREVRLDTRADLVEARALYAKHGYVELPVPSEGAYNDHSFSKAVG